MLLEQQANIKAKMHAINIEDVIQVVKHFTEEQRIRKKGPAQVI